MARATVRGLMTLGLDKPAVDHLMTLIRAARSLEDGEEVIRQAAQVMPGAVGVDYLAPLGATVALYVRREHWQQRTLLYNVASERFLVVSGDEYLRNWLRAHRVAVTGLE